MNFRLLKLAMVSTALIYFAQGAPASSEHSPTSTISKALKTIDLVLQHHIDPPTRQEMFLHGLRSLYLSAGTNPPSTLAREISSFTKPQDFETYLSRVHRDLNIAQLPINKLELHFLNAILTPVPGRAQYVPAKDFRVNQQLEANRYIGIGIALRGWEEGKSEYAEVIQVFRDGPAYQAGMKVKDFILKIDGADLAGIKLEKVIDLIRGPEGSSVTIQFGNPKAETREVKIVRSVVPRETINGFKQRKDDSWDIALKPKIGYIRILELASSTVHELKKYEQDFYDNKFLGLVLDLRFAHGNLHNTVLFADALMEKAIIGQVKTTSAVRKYESDPDALFRDIPIVVLIQPNVIAETEWLVAALKDSGRALIVGEHTSGAGYTSSPIPLGDTGDAITLATGVLERADGRPLLKHNRISTSLVQSIERKSREITHGVAPDFTAANSDFRRNDDSATKEKLDAALDKAVEVLEKKLPQAS